MGYSFINIHTKSKVALETDRYLIHRRIKSKLSYSENYLEIKTLPRNEDEIDFYISACRNFFRDKGVNFIHIALPENERLDKKLEKYLEKNGFNKMQLDLYVLDRNKKINRTIDSEYEFGELEKADYTKFMDFNYQIDIELANKEWADHNRDNIYENIRSEEIIQIVAKDKDTIIGCANIILDDDYFEIDNLYVSENYRRKGVASNIINYAIENFKKNNIILVADFDDTPKYMYENIGFEQQSSQIYFLKTEL